MHLRLNHLQEKAAVSAHDVAATLDSLAQEGRIPAEQLAHFRVELDWIQYKQNFREPVLFSQTHNGHSGGHASVAELRIDTRQIEPGGLRGEILRAIANASAETPGHVPLEDFHSLRHSITWNFNQLYWSRFTDWEQWTGRSYETALPGGFSDAHNPVAVADGVGDFWTMLRDLESKGQLPPEIFFLEIGVGTGTRCGLWLDQFQTLDNRRGTHYYPRLRVLLGDYSLATLDQSRPAVEKHAGLCSFLVLDARDPFKSLSFLRDKILHIHTTNVYDNLPDEEYLRHDGRLYQVQVRAYVPQADAERISAMCSIPADQYRATVERLIVSGPEYFGDHARGMTFWQETWRALRLEERLVSVDNLTDPGFPADLDAAALGEIMAHAPSNLRFHLSSGALESFTNTLPLLHARGYMQIQDIFVREFEEYEKGFRGPGKMDGSIVNWVNGALLKGVGERAGYDVHFAPFRYRKGSYTSVLYATRRS
jgi:hypothetical protein